MGQEMRDRSFERFWIENGHGFGHGSVGYLLAKRAYAAGEESMRERAAKFVEEPRAQALYRSEIAAAIRGLALEGGE